MVRSYSIAGVALALGVASSAAAQTTSAPPRTPLPAAPTSSFVRPFFPGFADTSAPNNVQRAIALQRKIFVEQQTRRVLAEEPPARLDRARRVGALIDQGQCGQAAQLARAEHDDRMADRVPAACGAHRQSRLG